MFPHLQVILPHLKGHFERAYICPPLSTQKHVDHMQQLQADDFFTIFPADRNMQIGEHFAYLYQRAAEAAPPEQIVHLCYLDRLAFALEGVSFFMEAIFIAIYVYGWDRLSPRAHLLSGIPIVSRRCE